jgi:hypothetical protein
MAPPSPFDRARFRAGRVLVIIALGLAGTAATLSLHAGRFDRAVLPLSSIALGLWWLTQGSRKDAA